MIRSLSVFLLCSLFLMSNSALADPSTKHHCYSKDCSKKSGHSKTHKSKSSHGFSQTRAATGKRIFIFDPKIRRYAAYDESGILVATGQASGGSDYCRDIHRRCHTPVGSFSVLSKRGAGCKSTRYPIGRGGAPMPYCNFFTTNFAIHGSYEVRSYNASHGCIRIHPKEAAWLSSNFFRIGTKVIVEPY